MCGDLSGGGWPLSVAAHRPSERSTLWPSRKQRAGGRIGGLRQAQAQALRAQVTQDAVKLEAEGAAVRRPLDERLEGQVAAAVVRVLGVAGQPRRLRLHARHGVRRMSRPTHRGLPRPGEEVGLRLRRGLERLSGGQRDGPDDAFSAAGQFRCAGRRARGADRPHHKLRQGGAVERGTAAGREGQRASASRFCLWDRREVSGLRTVR